MDGTIRRIPPQQRAHAATAAQRSIYGTVGHIVIVHVQLLESACRKMAGTSLQGIEQALLAHPIHPIGQSVDVTGTKRFQRLMPLSDHIMYIGTRQRGPDFGMIFDETFHRRQISFLHGDRESHRHRPCQRPHRLRSHRD